MKHRPIKFADCIECCLPMEALRDHQMREVCWDCGGTTLEQQVAGITQAQIKRRARK